MQRCWQCTAPNPAGRASCYSCGASLTAPPTAAPGYAPAAVGGPPPMVAPAFSPPLDDPGGWSLENARGVLFEPVEFFQYQRGFRGLWPPITYLAVGMFLAMLLPMGIIVFQGFSKNPGEGVGLLLFALLIASLAIVVTIPLQMAFAGLYHLFALLFRGRGGYGGTFRASVYAQTPQLLLAPLGLMAIMLQYSAYPLSLFLFIAGAIWSFVLLMIGFRQIHEMPTGNAFFAGLLSAVSVAAVFYFMPPLPRSLLYGRADQTLCMSNMKQLSGAIMMYAQDYDEKLPLANNWVDGTNPYVKALAVFRCPTVMAESRGDRSKFGVAYNSNLSEVSLEKVTTPAATVMLYDSTNLALNASDPVSSLPSPPRHGGWNNLGFVDSHIKAVPPDQMGRYRAIPFEGSGDTGSGDTGKQEGSERPNIQILRQKVYPGLSRDQVLAKLGAPDSEHSGYMIYDCPDGRLTIQLEDDRVTAVESQ